MIISRFFLVILIFRAALTTSAQVPIKQFKSLADKKIQPYFSKAIFKKVSCNDYLEKLQKSDKETGDKYDYSTKTYYDPNSNKMLKIPRYTLLIYSLYSRDLHHKFYFHVVIDSDMVVYLPSGALMPKRPNGTIGDIPECVRMKKSCNFISKSEAMNIARKDSILYPNNLLVELKVSASTKQICWVVSGQQKSNVDYNKPEPEDGWNIFPLEKQNTRFVDAITGKIISFENWK